MDNTTLYRSPVRLVGHAGEPIGEYNPQNISRAKKKLLALISLGDNEMELNGLVYTKNDIISLLDGVTNEYEWQYHCTVYALPGLLQFLEEAFFDDGQLRREITANTGGAFLDFLSHPFAVAFNTASGILLRTNVMPQPAQISHDPLITSEPENQFQVASEVEEFDRFKVLQALVNYQQYIQLPHQYIAFERIRLYFHELVYMLRNLSWEKFRQDESLLHFVFTSSWIQFANSLPPAFATSRDEVADQVTNVALRFQHKATWHYLHLLCAELNMLECSDDLKQEIARLSNHFENNANIEAGNRNQKASKPSTGRYILWGIWILLGILRAGSSCNKSSYDYDTNRDYQYYRPEQGYPSIVKDSEVMYVDTTGLSGPNIVFDTMQAQPIRDTVESWKK